MRANLHNVSAYALLAVSLFMVAYAGLQYYTAARMTVPNVGALAPVTVDKVNEAIALRIPDDEGGRAARTLLALQADTARMLHSSWLAQAEAQASFAGMTLLAWSLALLGSAVVVGAARKGASSAP